MNIFKKIKKYKIFVEQIECLTNKIESRMHVLEGAKTTKFERGQLDACQQIFDYLNAKLKELEGDEQMSKADKMFEKLGYEKKDFGYKIEYK